VIQTIGSALPRHRTTLRGKIVSVNRMERPWVRTDAVVSDGTGTLVLRFVGRRSMPGLDAGRFVVVEGTPGLVGGELVMLNPLYSFDGAG
jgi:hypothetical protein